MKLQDFHIGREFWTETGPWRCTDVGSRTICAIQLGPVDIVRVGEDGTESCRREADPTFLEGPPYGVVEHVFDEFEGLYPSNVALRDGGGRVDGDKSGWNQRIIRTREGEETWFEIHEVYYDAQGQIESWTQEPVLPRGETKAELMNDIAHFVSALRHPVLLRSVEGGREMLVPDTSNQTVNEGHWPELMDRVFVVMSQCSDIILEHPILRDTPRLRAKAEAIIGTMADLYQEIGNRMVE